MMTPLYQELHLWAATPFQWGVCDCCLAPCDWVARQTGIDPAAAVRLTYDDAGSCQRATGFLRDPLGVASGWMAEAGLEVTPAPVAGDVGLIKVMAEGRVQIVGALCLGAGSWAIKTPGGVTTLAPRAVLSVLRAWGVGYAA